MPLPPYYPDSGILMRPFAVTALAGASMYGGGVHAATDEPPVHTLPSQVQQHVDLAYLALNGAITDSQLFTMVWRHRPRENMRGPAGQRRISW